MKKLLVLISLTICVYSCDKADPLPPGAFEINGTATGIYNGIRAYIRVPGERGREFTTDTAIIMNEKFYFKGQLPNASMRLLTINGINGKLSFVLEPGRLNMEIFKDSFNASRISGGKNNDIYNLFKVENKRKTVALKAASLEARETRNLPDKTLYNELTAKTNALSLELRNYSHEFIDQHADTDFALILLESMTRGRKPELERFKKNRLALNDIINKNNYNKALGAKVNDLIYQLEAQKNLDIGKIAPNFSSFTPEGKPLALNDIKGKATIIDFWAAWCGPCRRENPNVVKVYEKYHEKGLEIISISLDGTGRQKDPKAAWLKAVEDDKMNWHHVSSLSYFNDPVAKLYNITSIPATFILDAEGKIVAKRLRGDALEQQIAQMLN